MPAENTAKAIVFLLSAALSVTVVAAPAQSLTDELAERSGVSAAQVTTLLESCDANRTSMKFCALRDELAAERTLRHLINQKRATSPKCGAVLAQTVALWQKRRDESCLQTARQQWGDSTMLSAAVAMCATDRTKQMMQTLSSNACP